MESYKYKYNGKEFDRTHGLDWYDYSARQYDPAPHEFGHLLGHPDKYTDENGPFKGYENNIMGSTNGKAEDKNFDIILKNIWSGYEEWINNGNKGTFKYEINP